MRKFSMLFTTALFIFTGPMALAEKEDAKGTDYLPDGGVKITAPAEILLVSYDDCAKTFEIELVGEEGADYFYVTPEEVLSAVPSLNAQEVHKSPKEVLNRKFALGRGKKIIFHPSPFLDQQKEKNGCK